jgi:hypothetical protein
VRLLLEALQEARQTINDHLADVRSADERRRREALQLVNYKLTQLDQHLTASRRILNDLRSLRRMLQGERGLPVDRASEREVMTASAS